jgi:hypothetical protein
MLLPDKRDALVLGGVVVGVGLLVWFASTKAGQAAASSLGQALGQGAVNVATGAVSGAAIGVGNAVGLPDTSDAVTVSKGRQLLTEGKLFEASFYLPASEWLAAVKAKLFGGGAVSDTAAGTGANYTKPEPGVIYDTAPSSSDYH